MAQRHFYTWIHDTDGTKNDSFVPSSYISSYWNSLIFDVNHRTIWHQGMPYGNAYPGTASYGEVFNDIDNNVGKAAYGHAEGYHTTVTYIGSDNEYSAGAHAEGISTIGYAKAVHTEGVFTAAYAVGSHVEGLYNISYGSYSHAEGGSNTTYGTYSHAEGDGCIARGTSSHAEGSQTNAIKDYSHSEGNKTNASGESSHAEGSGSEATAMAAHAEGETTHATGRAAHAEGINTQSSGNYAHAENNNTVANGESSHAEGIGTIAWTQFSHAEGVETTANGEGSHVEGYKNKTTNNAKYSHVEGSSNTDNGLTNHIEGYNNSTIGLNATYTHVEGYENKDISGTAAHVSGYNNKNIGDRTSVSGQNNNVASSNSVVGGDKNIDKNGVNNFVVGNTNTLNSVNNGIVSGTTNKVTSSDNSIVSGNNNEVTGNNNLVLGVNTNIKSTNSIIIGEDNIILNDDIKEHNALVGKGLTVHNNYEMSIGKYNFSYWEGGDERSLDGKTTNTNNKNKTIFSLGIGDVDTRKNALDVRENGTAYLYNISYTWDNGWEEDKKAFPEGLYPIATTSYVLRHGVGMKNWIFDKAGNQAYTTAEYFNDYITPNNAYGPYSHAEGKQTYTYYTSTGGHAEGIGTQVRNEGEHASGKYNQSILGSTLFTIGSGQSTVSRSNQFTVYYGDGASDGIAKLQNDVVVANRSGVSATDESLNWYTTSKATYLWSGSYDNYTDMITSKGNADMNTIYFIEDGDANDRNDFVTKDDITYIIEKMNAATDQKIHGVVKSASSIQTSDPLLSVIANSCSAPADTTYIWTGSDTEYDNIKSSIDEILSDESNVSYWIVKNMQFVIHNR